jgi:hypothetical protein
MNGFISESTSKISDGFGTAVYLFTLHISTRFLYSLIDKSSIKPGEFVFILLPVALGVFMLVRAFTGTRPVEQRADAGLAAGALLWQVTLFVYLLISGGLFEYISWVIWLLGVLSTIVLWPRILSLGLRFFTLVYLLMWAGTLYVDLLAFISGWPTIFIAIYHAVRMAALAGVLVFLWVIVYRSSNSMQRKVCGVGLAFCVLLGLNLF